LKKLVKEKTPLLEEDKDWEKKRKKAMQEKLKSGEAWGKEVTRKACKSCRGQCCTIAGMSVLLDREAVERRLHEFKGDYEYNKRLHTCFILDALGRKNTQAPVLKHREDGSCIYFDRKLKRCSIYKNRPASCKVFFCGRGTRKDLTWQGIREREKKEMAQKKLKKKRLGLIEEAKNRVTFINGREMPMLDAILSGQKLWDSAALPDYQKAQMRRVRKKLKEEHEYMLEHEPQDEFHACVLLGALNVVDAALSRKKVLSI
jgi:Fe-S-cluster containining protein